MPDHAANPFVLRVEISAEQVPRLREALSANGNDGDLTRRATELAADEERIRQEQAELADLTRRAAEVNEREEKMRQEQAELEERARKLSEREAELGSSNDLTASERIRLAQRRERIEFSEHELETRENELLTREAEFEADVLFREERMQRWRAELTSLEEELERRERDLATYVADLQEAVTDGSQFPPGPGVSALRRSA